MDSLLTNWVRCHRAAGWAPAELDVLWAQIDADDHAARCIAAHYIADAQGDLDAEVGWDETSLTEVAPTDDDELRAITRRYVWPGFLPVAAPQR